MVSVGMHQANAISETKPLEERGEEWWSERGEPTRKITTAPQL